MRPKRATSAADDPVHMYARVGDEHSICGLDRPLPVVLARHAQAHVDGWGAVLCPDCVNPPGQLDLFEVMA